MADGMIRRRKHPQEVRRRLPGSMAATLSQTEDGGQSFCAAVPRLFAQVSAFCLLSSVLYPLAAEELPDPTQPPAGIYALSSGRGTAATTNIVSPSSNGLHSIIISPNRRAAIINGEMVELGAKVGSARLVEVSESGVVLQSERGRKELALFPGVWLKMKASASPGQARNKAKSANEAVEDALPKEEK